MSSTGHNKGYNFFMLQDNSNNQGTWYYSWVRAKIQSLTGQEGRVFETNEYSKYVGCLNSSMIQYEMLVRQFSPASIKEIFNRLLSN